MNMITHRVSPQQARYTPAGGREKCSFCRFYIAPKWCGHVTGPVSPMGWCKYFSQEMRAQFGGSQAVAIGPPGATLDLGFMTPGTLDPRITFTRASTATYTDAAGTIQPAAINQPRWDYAGGSLRGLLLEDARTNLIPNSIPVAGWAPTDVLLTGASGIAPDGTNTMVRIAEDGVNTFHMNLLLATVVASTTYAVSVYAKAAQVRYLQVLLDNNGGVGSWATFDLQTGTISGPIAMNGVTGSGASIQAAGNGIYRCVVTSTVGASTTGRVSLGLSNVPNPGAFPGYQGNPANGLLIWGAQLEQGGFATSYIPTAGTAVTRAIDGCAISPANMSPWFASPGGSWVVELISFNPAPANSRVVGQANVAGSICPIYIDSAAKGGQFDGVSAVTTANATVANVVTKISSAWGVGQAKACANGGVVASSAALTTGYGALVASGIKFMTLVAAAPADCTNGYIRRVQYWPRVLSDAEMQQVTT